MITAPQLASQLDLAVVDRPSVLVADLSSGTSVRVVGQEHETVRPIQLLGLDRTLPVYPTVSDALSERTSDE